MPLLDLILAMLWFFVLLAWVGAVLVVLGDVFRSEDLGGFAKAGWLFFVIAIPWLGVLTYMIARGSTMPERSYRAAVKHRRRDRDRIAGTGSEIHTWLV